MKVTVPARDRAEANAIKTAMDDPAVRAFVSVVGILQQLPTKRSRARVLAFISDMVNDIESWSPPVTANRLALADEETADAPHPRPGLAGVMVD